ncbi:hypothetical protein FD24_GL000820 [Lactiplantibacillus pentosus DSM 20314]|uniref:Uncharacterized protein n=1 Tax=Lactiplantibacillus pentosus DSM 20314 TaxID=1423791 RepID=A0A837R8E8_LACPE|nr:hypothetical protein FD24_GL000820 [Lactiplantibacillus pentosus DSM 20314]
MQLAFNNQLETKQIGRKTKFGFPSYLYTTRIIDHPGRLLIFDYLFSEPLAGWE